MTEPKVNPERCPCKRIKCERHGDCAACRAHHSVEKNTPAACDRKRAKEEKRAGKR